MSATKEARDRAASEQARQLSNYVEAATREHTDFARSMVSAGDDVEASASYRAHVVEAHERALAMLLTAQERLLAARAATATEFARLVADTEAHAATVTAAAIARHSTATGSVDAALMEGFRGEAEELERNVGALLADHAVRTATYEQCVQTVLDEWVAFEEQSRSELGRRAAELAAQRLHRAHLGAARLLREANAVASARPGSPLPPPPLTPASVPVVEYEIEEAGDDGGVDTGPEADAELDAAPRPPARWWRRIGGSALPVIGVATVIAVIMLLIG
jgi:hypothetical protein